MAEYRSEVEEPGANSIDGSILPTAPPPNQTGDKLTSSSSTSTETQQHKPVLIRDRYLILLDKPLLELDQPSAKAYEAEDRRDLSRKIYALACNPGIPIRMETIQAIRGKHYRGILPLVDWEVADWPLLGQSTSVIIYERPLGGSIAEQIQQRESLITTDDIRYKFASPLIDGLRTLNDVAGPHRAIRLNNIFYLDKNMEEIVLGPNVTSPPGFDQPSSFETVYRSICIPEGRGLGDLSDDIYALATTFVQLIKGSDSLTNSKDEELIFQRLENSSYSCVCSETQVPSELIGPLRGMMHDDPSIRWNVETIIDWIEKKIVKPVEDPLVKKVGTPFVFRNREHYRFSTLAVHLSQYPQDAIRAFDDQHLINWINSYTDDSQSADSITKLLQEAVNKSDSLENPDSLLLSLILNLLDPKAPIHFKDMTFMPDGYGHMLAIYWSRRGDIQDPAQVLSQDILTNWFNSRGTIAPNFTDQQALFAKLKKTLSNNAHGFGLERVVYELNKGFPCQSQIIIKANLIEIECLLSALDDAANSEDTTTSPIDRHIAAFIASRFGETVEPHLKALASEKTDTSVVGMLSLLAFLQWKLEAPPMLGLSSWVGGLLGPAISSYHNRRTRDDLEKEIPKLVRKGSIPDLFKLIDDDAKRQEDEEGFHEAQDLWLEAEEEIRNIKNSNEERILIAEKTGQQTAATISIMLGLLLVSILLTSSVF